MRRFASIELSFHPCNILRDSRRGVSRGNKNVGCRTWKLRFFNCCKLHNFITVVNYTIVAALIDSFMSNWSSVAYVRVNFLSTYSDKKSCHTSTTLQTSTRGLSAIAELLVYVPAQTHEPTRQSLITLRSGGYGHAWRLSVPSLFIFAVLSTVLCGQVLGTPSWRVPTVNVPIHSWTLSIGSPVSKSCIIETAA